jgi:hypothetical protein
VTDNRRLDPATLQAIRKTCLSLTGVAYWTTTDITSTGVEVAVPRPLYWEQSELDLMRLCVDIFASSYDCSERKLQLLLQALRLAEGGSEKLLYVYPTFDDERLPITCGQGHSPDISLDSPLFPRVIVVDFRSAPLKKKPMIVWIERLFRQLMSGLAHGLKKNLETGKVDKNDPSTTLVFRGLRGFEVVKQILGLVCTVSNDANETDLLLKVKCRLRTFPRRYLGGDNDRDDDTSERSNALLVYRSGSACQLATEIRCCRLQASLWCMGTGSGQDVFISRRQDFFGSQSGVQHLDEDGPPKNQYTRT